MSASYSVIPSAPVQKGATFQKPIQELVQSVTMDAPALMVMTDFREVTAHTTHPLETIESARLKMINRAVRLLLVVDEQNQILGLITSTDLTSEKPMQIIQTQGIRHTDVLVKDIMTPREKLETLCMDDVAKAKVGDVVATLKACGRQHALVAERQPDRSQIVRGLFSVSQLSRQLGTSVQTVEVARTFAEIGAELIR
ncbi:MAG: CBS domain-containing protein [Hydrogenophilaceae bacterium]|nr:CBS domain-containing protein [Hydrogenophilaceae bacterium]